MNWQILLAYDEQPFCPDCEDDLQLFEHLSAYKCRTCNLFITVASLERIRAILLEDTSITGVSDGFCYRNYSDDAPF